MDESRHSYVRKKKRKLRKGRVFFTILILLAITAIIYSYTQYKEGQKLASNTVQKTEQKVIHKQSRI